MAELKPRAIRKHHLGSLVRQRVHRPSDWFAGVYNLHLLPVIGKFPAAIETYDISSGGRSGVIATLSCTDGNRKAVFRMPAAKKSIEQFPDHPTLPEPGPGAESKQRSQLLRSSSE